MTREKTVNIPMSADHLALLDLDETVLDTTYTVTHSSVYEAIKRTQSQGWAVGISSDRGFDGVAQWAQHLGVDGPVIAERGAIIGYEGLVVEDELDCHVFLESKQRIIERLQETGMVVVEGDPYHVLREKPPTRAIETGKVAVINGIRRHSVGLHVRAVDGSGATEIDDSLTIAATDSIRPLLPAFSDLQEDLNHNYGVFIASRESTTKRRGTLQLLGVMGMERCTMVGDTMNDFLGKDIASHYAVQNATPEFKQVADYVSTEPRAAGVSEILAALVACS